MFGCIWDGKRESKTMENQCFLLLFRKRENVKMAASCRRERQNGGLKGSGRQQKTVSKQCRKAHGILMHFGSEHVTQNEPTCCQKPFKKLMKKSLKTASKNGGQMYRKRKPKGRQRRPKTPTSCRQNPDMEPGTPRDAKKEPKWTPNGPLNGSKSGPCEIPENTLIFELIVELLLDLILSSFSCPFLERPVFAKYAPRAGESSIFKAPASQN